MFRFTDFQNNCFIAKVFAVLVMYQRCFYDKSQDIWKNSLFSKKTTLTNAWNKWKKEILNDRSLRPV